jgi:hypothetical protein
MQRIAGATAPEVQAPVPQRPWTPQPAGSSLLVFREVQIGMLPGRGRRETWTLIRSGNAVLVRLEEQSSAATIAHLNRESLDPGKWLPATPTEYAGTATANASGFRMTLHRNFGTHEPEQLVLDCAPKTVVVHPVFATLVEGWVNSDDTTKPATWAPARTERVQALNCREPDGLGTFSDGLSFVSGKGATKKDPALSGVEWAFVNSDMVIQQGGYRWIPSFSLRDAP